MSESLINRLIDMHKQIFLYGNWLLELRYQVLQEKEENIRLRSERDTAKKELEELKAKLPKTADGVTCFGGEIVYQYERDEEEDDEYVDTYMVVRDESGWSVVSYANKNLYHYELPEISECYSTEQAAREAGEAKNIPE